MEYTHFVVIDRMDSDITVHPYSEAAFNAAKARHPKVLRVKGLQALTSLVQGGGQTSAVPSPGAVGGGHFDGSIGGSMWILECAGWRGYIDFLTDGRYWTHWGLGHWEMAPDGRVKMRNTYDPFYFILEFSSDRQGLKGPRYPDNLPTTARFWTRYP